jgi:hypothetical protein
MLAKIDIIFNNCQVFALKIRQCDKEKAKMLAK